MGVVAMLIGLVPMLLVTFIMVSLLRRKDQDIQGPLLGYGMMLGIFTITEVTIINSVLSH